MPRPPRATAAAAVLAAALPGVLPYHRLIDVSAESDTLALLPLWWLQETVVSIDTIAVVVVAAAAAIAGLFFSISPRYALVLPAVVLAWFAFATERIERFDHGFPKASVGALYQGITEPRRDWVDAAVGRDADVAFVFAGENPTEQPLTLWENEFYNRSIGHVYDLRQPSMGGLPETHVRERPDGVLVLPSGRPVRHEYALSGEALPLAGRVVAHDERKGMVLRKTGGLVRIAYQVSGLYPNDTWSGPSVTYTRLRCSGGRVTAQITSDARLFSRQTVRSGRHSLTFRPADTVDFTVPLRPSAGVCRAVFTITPTATPALVEPGSTDTRALGAHFLRFTYASP
jgi:hypothetical protein